ncbi:M23 family metallopeptidase [Salinarimonas sp.]|uniref:M23 family metallopeptidase n=1 Tax=Salinarimonas sp. TaxID=2766526 RepID=UPI0032D916F4
MRFPQALPRFPVVTKVAVVALAAGALGACSADTMRFADPFGNPFSRSGPEPVMTAAAPGGAAPTMAVASAPLPEPTVTGATNASLPAQPATGAPRATGPAGWSALGGTPIVVRQGETLDTIAGRYNVPADALLRVNGLSSASEVQPGRALVIPVYNAVGAQTASAAGATPLPVQSAAAPIPPRAPGARSAAPTQTASISSAAPIPPAAPARQAAIATPAAPPPAAVQQAPVQQAAPAQPSPAPSAPTQVARLPDPASNLDFRWPARGRVIAGFGTAGNEGINIALPEGTPVRAAEGGTVAYAGEELRGYGKLVLVRHADGYVSAYAHNSQLLVGRGDEVRRGQVIAHSGRTGNVTSPQLHFEIRKGADPVDPMPYLTN